MSKINHAVLIEVFLFFFYFNFYDNYVAWGEIEKRRGRQVKYNRICPCDSKRFMIRYIKKKPHYIMQITEETKHSD